MPEVPSCDRSKTFTRQLCKVDDESDTSDTTDSREERGDQNEGCEVEVVAMDSSEVVVAQDGAVESCDVVQSSMGDQLEKEPLSDKMNRSNNNGKINKKVTTSEEQVPDRQKSAMQAFLASPTGLNWDDLVRSMREEMFIKTVTIKQNQSDDSSSIGSLGSSGKNDNTSTGSMNSSLSSKSAFLRRTRGKAKVKGSPGRRNRKRKESLERKVERVLSGNDRKLKNYDESHPLMAKSKVVGGKRCAFSAVTKLPAIPCSPNTPLKESESNTGSTHVPSMIERDTWFNPVEEPPTPCQSDEIVSPQPVGKLIPAQEQIQIIAANCTVANKKISTATSAPVQDPPLLLKLSTSADSEDSFYYHIRGRPSKEGFKSSGSTSKTKGHKNPYAFSNHPLLPAVVEEGNIPPFPTTFDELDGENEYIDSDEELTIQHEDEEPAGQALGSFAASIGQTDQTSSLARLQIYKSSTKSRRRRKRSFWMILAPCCTRTRAEI